MYNKSINHHNGVLMDSKYRKFQIIWQYHKFYTFPISFKQEKVFANFSDSYADIILIFCAE
jgi:hypothetical protein